MIGIHGSAYSLHISSQSYSSVLWFPLFPNMSHTILKIDSPFTPQLCHTLLVYYAPPPPTYQHPQPPKVKVSFLLWFSFYTSNLWDLDLFRFVWIHSFRFMIFILTLNFRYLIHSRLQYWIHLTCYTILSLFNLDLLVFRLNIWILDLHLLHLGLIAHIGIFILGLVYYWFWTCNFGFWTVGLFKLGSELLDFLNLHFELYFFVIAWPHLKTLVKLWTSDT